MASKVLKKKKWLDTLYILIFYTLDNVHNKCDDT